MSWSDEPADQAVLGTVGLRWRWRALAVPASRRTGAGGRVPKSGGRPAWLPAGGSDGCSRPSPAQQRKSCWMAATAYDDVGTDAAEPGLGRRQKHLRPASRAR